MDWVVGVVQGGSKKVFCLYLGFVCPLKARPCGKVVKTLSGRVDGMNSLLDLAMSEWCLTT